MERQKRYSKTIIGMCMTLLGMLSCGHAGQTGVIAERERIDTLLISRFDSVYTNPDLMEKRFREAQKRLTDSMSYYRLELFAGYCRHLMGNTPDAVSINRKVMAYARSHEGCEALEAMCWNHRRALLLGMNMRDSSIACLHHAYDALYRTSDRRELENICINLADEYRQKGDWDSAARYYRKALWVADSLGSEKVRFSIYVGLAQVYADMHNFSQAHHYFDMAERNPEERLEYEEYYFLNSKGNCYYFEERYTEALDCFMKAYGIVRKFSQPSLDALTEANIGEIYTLLGRYDSAHFYLDKSYAHFAQAPQANEDAMFYLNSLQAALALNEHRLDEAGRYLSKPYNPERVEPSYMYLHNKRLMEYYERQGDWRKAYMYREMVEKYNDSIRNERHMNSIAEIDYRYRQDTTLLKRDILIAGKNVQLSEQHTTIVFIVALLLIVVLGAVLVFVYVRRKNERIYARQLALVTRLRMDNVKNRISPHFTLNVLNTIMPAMRQYEELSHKLQLFVKVLRSNLLASDKVAMTLAEEMEVVKDFVSLREQTNPVTPHVSWHVDETVDTGILVPTMCIQIPVENALKYAFDGMEGCGEITVSIDGRDRGALVSIRDNGFGYNPGAHSNSERGTGNGLKMLYRTVEMLNARNTVKMRFDIRNLSDAGERGTLVTIYIPYSYQFNL